MRELATSFCLFILVVLNACPGSMQGQTLAEEPAKTRPAEPKAAKTVCDAKPGESRFEPACYVRVFEDTGNGKRLVLYAPENLELNSRLLKADADSTLIIDVSRALDPDGTGDIALNKILIKAQMKRGNEMMPVQVIGYSEIGQDEQNRESQNAFAFQTFDNVAGKLVNLYFTTRDLIESTYKSGCWSALAGGEKSRAEVLKTECSSPNMELFTRRLDLYAPEAEALADFFIQAQNRSIVAELATDVFEVDIESLQGAVAQIKAERAKLASSDTSAQGRGNATDRILERVKLSVQDLAGVIKGTRAIKEAFDRIGSKEDAEADEFLRQTCKATLAEAKLHLKLVDAYEFSRSCYKEHKKPLYIEKLRKYLVEGTISLAGSNAQSGDVVILTVEAKGPNPQSPGMRSEFRIRIGDYGWKVGIRETLMFIKRIGVNEADGNRPATDPVKNLQPVRFSPFPGFNFVATYNGQHKGGLALKREAGESRYGNLRPSDGVGAKFGRVLAPGIGINLMFLTFGARRDFDPTAGTGGQFVTTKGNNFEIGTGPCSACSTTESARHTDGT